MIFNIQKCSVHDGTGLRTLVFFKGCPLRCPWCANPESQSFEKEIMEVPRKCIGCMACVNRCPNKAIIVSDGGFTINRSLCRNCFVCTDICYAEAKQAVGKKMSTEELFNEINKDRLFYQYFGGGVTFSGGEPLTHSKELTDILRKCKSNHINTAIETCGMGSFDEFKSVLPYLDEMFFDIKLIDSIEHKNVTSLGNEIILDNLKRISSYDIPITIRTPIVPGYTDSEENIKGIANFIKDIPNVQGYELLPYHSLGKSKYASLGREYKLNEVNPPGDEMMEALVKMANQILCSHGIPCYYTVKNRKEIIK